MAPKLAFSRKGVRLPLLLAHLTIFVCIIPKLFTERYELRDSLMQRECRVGFPFNKATGRLAFPSGSFLVSFWSVSLYS